MQAGNRAIDVLQYHFSLAWPAPKQPQSPKAEGCGRNGDQNVPGFGRQLRPFLDAAPDMCHSEQTKNSAGGYHVGLHMTAPTILEYVAVTTRGHRPAQKLGSTQRCLMKVPSCRSAIACLSCSCVFITIGPYQATGSSIGWPDTRRNRIPSGPACTVISSPRSNSTSE
jgi:hypothetical protein